MPEFEDSSPKRQKSKIFYLYIFMLITWYNNSILDYWVG